MKREDECMKEENSKQSKNQQELYYNILLESVL